MKSKDEELEGDDGVATSNFVFILVMNAVYILLFYFLMKSLT